MIMKFSLSVCLGCGYIYQFMYVKPFWNFRDQTYLITLYVIFVLFFVCLFVFYVSVVFSLQACKYFAGRPCQLINSYSLSWLGSGSQKLEYMETLSLPRVTSGSLSALSEACPRNQRADFLWAFSKPDA